MIEVGCRIGELLSLRMKNMQFDQYGCIIIVPEGKTGSRRIRIIDKNTTIALLNWLDLHPLKNDPEAYVWLSQKTKKLPITYNDVLYQLTKLTRIALGMLRQLI